MQNLSAKFSLPAIVPEYSLTFGNISPHCMIKIPFICPKIKLSQTPVSFQRNRFLSCFFQKQYQLSEYFPAVTAVCCSKLYFLLFNPAPRYSATSIPAGVRTASDHPWTLSVVLSIVLPCRTMYRTTSLSLAAECDTIPVTKIEIKFQKLQKSFFHWKFTFSVCMNSKTD